MRMSVSVSFSVGEYGKTRMCRIKKFGTCGRAAAVMPGFEYGDIVRQFRPMRGYIIKHSLLG